MVRPCKWDPVFLAHSDSYIHHMNDRNILTSNGFELLLEMDVCTYVKKKKNRKMQNTAIDAVFIQIDCVVFSRTSCMCTVYVQCTVALVTHTHLIGLQCGNLLITFGSSSFECFLVNIVLLRKYTQVMQCTMFAQYMPFSFIQMS